MRTEILCFDPLVMLIYDFLTSAESAYLVTTATPLLTRSTVVCDRPDGRCVTEGRTSESATLPESPTTKAIQDRAKAISERPECEQLQVVRYLPGQEFKPHFDQFDPKLEEGRKRIQQGGQRRATFLVYLQCPEAGGATVFPNLGLDIAPVKNAAVYWPHQDKFGETHQGTLHGGAPVTRGVKYALNIWLR